MDLKIILLMLIGVLCLSAGTNADQTKPQSEPLGIAIENYPYPYPVEYMDSAIEGQDVRMAYMDIRPEEQVKGKNVLLLHGKNFFGAYWEETIAFLTGHGFRVVVPDQIGFGKSSKPDIHYSFHLLAQNTKRLLNELGVEKVSVVGHSMGGMLAVRFTLMYPDSVEHLVLENPIGLEDYKVKIPYSTVEEVYNSVLKSTEEGIRKYHEAYYTEWKPEYEKYVQVHYRWTLSGEYPRLAWASALTSQMIYTQPVVYEFPNIGAPTLLIIGQDDRTTLGRGEVSPEVLATLGNYPELGKKAAKAIPNSKLVEMEGVGHIPHLEATDKFHQALLEFIEE